MPRTGEMTWHRSAWQLYMPTEGSTFRGVPLLFKKSQLRSRVKTDAEVRLTRTWTHEYPLTYEELTEMGLPVSTEMPPEVYEFIKLFPQPKEKIPTVQYVQRLFSLSPLLNF